MPVIVVRPTSKRDKARSKRANDPDRQGYRDILAKSESLIDFNSSRNSFFANDEEASAVSAKHTARKPSGDVHPLAQVAHAEDSEDDREAAINNLADDLRSPLPLMKSPHLRDLDSPELSSEPNSSDDEDDGGVSTNTGSSHLAEVMAGTGGSSKNSGEADTATNTTSSVPAAGLQPQGPKDDPPTQKTPEGV